MKAHLSEADKFYITSHWQHCSAEELAAKTKKPLELVNKYLQEVKDTLKDVAQPVSRDGTVVMTGAASHAADEIQRLTKVERKDDPGRIHQCKKK